MKYLGELTKIFSTWNPNQKFICKTKRRRKQALHDERLHEQRRNPKKNRI
jgi:hypothetical protein